MSFCKYETLQIFESMQERKHTSKERFIFLKAKLFYNKGRSVRLERIALFVNLGMLELYYQLQTLHGDSCNS